MTDWQQWHEQYKDPHSGLSRRLSVVQRLLRVALDARPQPTIISLCAGDGRDLIGVLAERNDTAARALLVEYDPQLVSAGRAALAATNLDGVELRQGDAADMAHYQSHLPADILLACGVFGNISDADVFNTIEHLPQLIAHDGLVIWTRGRRDLDFTPAIRQHLSAVGFLETDFVAPHDALFSVGMAQFQGATEPFRAGDHLFEFIAR